MLKAEQAVAITGMGIISAIGQSTAAFKQALLYGKSNFTLSHLYPMLSFPLVGSFISDSDLIKTPPLFPKIKKTRSIELALIAAAEAWQQADAIQRPFDPRRISIVVAAQNSTTQYQYDLYDKFKENPHLISPSYALHFMDSDHIGILSEVFNILGEGFTIGGASASGNIALLRAYQLVRDQSQDACLVVGTLANLSPMELQAFHNLGALGGQGFATEPSQACRPFDLAHNGFIYGQASACIILESIQSAVKRGATILGYIVGGAMALDGNRLSHSTQTGEIHVMEKALKTSGILAKDIEYINTHGTSTPNGDQVEIAAIEAVFGSHSVYLNSTKSITGHCLWSAGIVETIATIIQMREGFLHPNLEQPISKNSRFVRDKREFTNINMALNNSFGFGGINTTLVLAKSII